MKEIWWSNSKCYVMSDVGTAWYTASPNNNNNIDISTTTTTSSKGLVTTLGHQMRIHRKIFTFCGSAA